MLKGAKGCSVPAVERRISVSPSCQPSVIEMSYVDPTTSETVVIERNQDVVGVCGDTIRRICESFGCFCGGRSCGGAAPF